ncbi:MULTISPECIES: DNA cytosine methyltransferase [Corynebacterium]|uniref:Cytosine-specific methyltransferase n=2 Tax=Corynebacterium glucuronolyticum TaxID=39791 RepID=A0A7T4EF59_9CORY|nr:MULTISPECIES: DNA (cytosine-5-)-methyltransferase [Corynebacterium]EEI28269.1 DNA (cytosine-5-)-methyltransferase [Corynebacterium glucuronolyticum ATCC 51867]EEI63370.1 DNA (cytosine-5-)-methyltransferase [Corynebacterium glucuronolyticum ATCC 51866]MCT1441977.1 DNA (cytosine-5-)-methyltransferase [Corynebacterium glucuronolyticum]MCT1564378.1 DNA (cytosine-5-)-methyltransferase [Corynebacterium glucuronolyticum]OFO47869.1 DNA cytosine methyltransferase [Corynebacterium sp. HMSC073D01]
MTNAKKPFTSVEICAGGGGQALGLERAGFEHLAVVEIDSNACETLRLNRGEEWNIVEQDVHTFDGAPYKGVDLFAGGVPCPPFSIAGKQRGPEDERDLFPRALDLIDQIKPRAVLLENVKGLGQKRFDDYRAKIIERLNQMGYDVFWELIQSADYGVPQLRPRFILVALRKEYSPYFEFPEPMPHRITVGEALHGLMEEKGWPGADLWAKRANNVAPTLVGGSKKHGGPDVGPTRARAAWAKLGVRGTSIAEEAPGVDFTTDADIDMPRLTVRMGAVIQGFPEDWKWAGGKTAQWRQVGNAFPPPVAEAIGTAISKALRQVEVFPCQESIAF